MNGVKLKKKEGADGYFINSRKRFRVLNKILMARPTASAIGIFRESKNTWFVRSDEKDCGDAIWVEATFEEVSEYQKTGRKDFLKEELIL